MMNPEKVPPPMTPVSAFSDPPQYNDSFKSVTLEYLDTTTAHGLPSVITKRRKIQKVLWFLIFWALMGYAVYQLFGIVNEFNEYQVTVKTLKKHRNLAEFPAVTICNENKLKKSKLGGTNYASIIELQQKYSEEVFGPSAPTTSNTAGSSLPTNVANSTALQNVGTASLLNTTTNGTSSTNLTNTISNAVSNLTNNVSNLTSPLTNSTGNTNPTGSTGLNLPSIPLGRKKRQILSGNTLSPRVPPGESGTNNLLSMELKGDHDYETLFASSKTSDFSDVVSMLRPSMPDLDKYGHQFDEFVLMCTFDGENCTSDDFVRVYNEVYGNCFTFNRQTNGSTVRTTTKFGSQYGLKLSLNIEKDEYLGLFSHQYGARVTVHSNNITAFPQDNSVSIPVGYYASVAVDTEVMDSKERPYETNCTHGKSADLFYEGLYSTDNCLNSCLRKMVKEVCSCVETVLVTGNESRCSISNTTEVACRLEVYANFRDNAYSCQHECNEPCLEVTYRTSVSYANWPTDGFNALVGRQLVGKMARNEIKEYIENNILRVNIFFRTLTYSHQQVFPTYTWETLLSNIGGTWGLFVGFSVCTFLEAAEYFLELICVCCGLSSKKKKEKVAPEGFNYAKGLS